MDQLQATILSNVQRQMKFVMSSVARFEFNGTISDHLGSRTKIRSRGNCQENDLVSCDTALNNH